MTAETPETAHRTPHSTPEPESESQGGPARGRAREDTEPPGAVPTIKERAAAVIPRLEATFRPPLVWTEAPASLSELAAYAFDGEWAGSNWFARFLGEWWCRLVAIPSSTVAYYAAWILQRPGRALTLVLIYFTVSQSDFGSWLPWLW